MPPEEKGLSAVDSEAGGGGEGEVGVVGVVGDGVDELFGEGVGALHFGYI